MKNKLVMTKGLPASGKTTWAKQQVREKGFKRINKDDLRRMVDDGVHTKSNERIIVSLRDVMVDELLSAGYSVVVDDTNLAPKHEERLYNIANKHDTIFEVKDFTDVPVEICIQRDRGRPDYVGEQVIKRMYKEHIQSPAQSYIKEINTSLPYCIIVDIDGTIANNTGVRHWNNFDDVYLDAVNDHILIIISKVLESYSLPIFFFSGREGTKNCYSETTRWIKDKVVENYYPIRTSIHRYGLNLEMRQEKDYRKDAIVKQEMYEKHINGKFNVLAVFDDRNQVVEMWRSLGLPTMQVADGDF